MGDFLGKMGLKLKEEDCEKLNENCKIVDGKLEVDIPDSECAAMVMNAVMGGGDNPVVNFIGGLFGKGDSDIAEKLKEFSKCVNLESLSKFQDL